MFAFDLGSTPFYDWISSRPRGATRPRPLKTPALVTLSIPTVMIASCYQNFQRRRYGLMDFSAGWDI